MQSLQSQLMLVHMAKVQFLARIALIEKLLADIVACLRSSDNTHRQSVKLWLLFGVVSISQCIWLVWSLNWSLTIVLCGLYLTRQYRPSARIERWVLWLVAFDYEALYKPGKDNIADPLPRLSVNSSKCKCGWGVHYDVCPKSLLFDTARKASIDCSEMGKLKNATLDGRWSSCLPTYRSIYDELSEVDGAVMRYNRIVMPVSMRSKAVERAHEGHQGITETKQSLRSNVWWRGMNNETERKWRECYECQVVSTPCRPPPMVSTGMPSQPWEHMACDLVGLYLMKKVLS